MLPVHVDTGPLSDLAREPNSAQSRALFSVFADGRAILAISELQLVELASPALKEDTFHAVRDLLRGAPIQLINSFEEVVDEEVAYAIGQVVSNGRRRPRVFPASISELGTWRVPPGRDAAGYLENLREFGAEEVVATAEGFAEAAMLKGAAALIRTPDVPVVLRVDRHLARCRERAPGYAQGLTAAEIVERAGGRAAFPYMDTHERLLSALLGQVTQQTKRSDIFDAYIAAYAPYVPVTIVDRRTLNRAREGRVPYIDRMTARPANVAAILERVASGDLQVVPSAYQPF